MSNLHKHTRLGGSGGMLPEEILEIRCSEMLLRPFWDRSTAILVTWLGSTASAIFSCMSMYAFTKPVDFKFSRTKVARTAVAWGDLTRRTTLERLN